MPKRNPRTQQKERPWTDNVKNDGTPKRSCVQQATPVWYGPFNDFYAINSY